MRAATIALVLGSAIVVTSCGGSGEAAASVRITGRVPAPATTTVQARASLAATAAVPTGVASTVLAFPIENGIISSTGVPEVVSTSLASDGAFDLTLQPNRDWMLVLVDGSRSGPSSFVGYVGATVSADNTLLALPTTAIGAAKTIALGTLTPPPAGSSTFESGATMTTVDFALSADGLSSLARADDALTALKNLLFNVQGQTFSQPVPSFAFRPIADAKLAPGAWGAPAGYALQPSWRVQVGSNLPSLRLDTLCATPPAVASLTSPGGLAMSSAGATCTGTAPNRRATAAAEFDAIEKSGQGPWGPHVGIEFGPWSGTPEVGDWPLVVDGGEVARFDLAVSTPVDALSRPSLVPVVRVTTDATGRITLLELRWYVPDAGTGFVEMVDRSAFPHIQRAVEVTIGQEVGDAMERFTLDPSRAVSAVPAQAWYAGGGDPARHADSVSVYLANGGVARTFITLLE